MVTEFRNVQEDGRGALEFVFGGRTTRAELSTGCNVTGTPVQPTLYDALKHNRIIAVGSAGFLAFFTWLGFFDQVRGVWDRLQKKGKDK